MVTVLLNLETPNLTNLPGIILHTLMVSSAVYTSTTGITNFLHHYGFRLTLLTDVRAVWCGYITVCTLEPIRSMRPISGTTRTLMVSSAVYTSTTGSTNVSHHSGFRLSLMTDVRALWCGYTHIVAMGSERDV